MVASGLKRRPFQGLLRLALWLLLLVSLVLLSEATQNSERFGRLHPWLLLFSGLALVTLVGLIGLNLWRLLRHGGQAGGRLTLRIMVLLVVSALVPVCVVYYFSMQFLRAGIDSWFDVRVERALEDALALSQAALDLRMRELLNRTEGVAADLFDVPDTLAALTLGDLRARTGAVELTLFGGNGSTIIASSSREPSAILPERPERNLLLQLRQGRHYVGLDPSDSGVLNVRVLVLAPDPANLQSPRVLQALYPISPRTNDLAESVQRAYGDYQELTYLRQPLKQSFGLTLSLVLLLTVLLAVWSAFYLARRLVAPVRDLAEATRALAAGDYGTQLPAAGRDELGFLVQSFNDMSRRIAQTREAAKRSQVQVEGQRAYLEAVLARLSSGVLALDYDGQLRTGNQAASLILGIPLAGELGEELATLAERHPHLRHFAETVERHLGGGEGEWREELALDGPEGRRVLICSGARLPGGHGTGGHVIVFDDVTSLIQAQRDVAWAEVARRLAHEIKNPLTPIQLAAERIRHKYLERMEGKDADVLERSTRTIVQQVEAMRDMVNAFSDYARPPRLSLQSVDLNQLVHEVVDLYRASAPHAHLELELDATLTPVLADPGRLRQLLHNLIKNALEAGQGQEPFELTLATLAGRERYEGMVELQVRDNGPGFSEEVLAQLFEPYVTTKPKGTGLGMAIVKKIVEEHSGLISARNAEPGALIVVRIPRVPLAAIPDKDKIKQLKLEAGA